MFIPGSIAKSGWQPAKLVTDHEDLLRIGPGNLCSGLVANTDNAMILQIGSLSKISLDLLANRRVNGAAEATIRGQGHMKDLGRAALFGLDLSVFVESLGTLAVRSKIKKKML